MTHNKIFIYSVKVYVVHFLASLLYKFMKFSENHIDTFFHTKNISIKKFKFKNLPTFNVILSGEKNEDSQELVNIFVQYLQYNYDILQCRYS